MQSVHVSHTIEAMVAVTVRFHAGDFFAEADVTVPRKATLAELLSDLITLTDAPRISRPWQPATLAGSPLSATVPLAETAVDHGDIIVFQPQHARPQPIARDAAESLAYAAQVSDKNITTALLTHGVSASALLLGLCVLLTWLPTWAALGIAGLAGTIVCLWKPQMWSVAWCTIACLASGVAAWVSVDHVAGWAAGLAAACVLVCAAHLCRIATVSVPVVAAFLSAGVLGSVGFAFQHGGPAVLAVHIMLLCGPLVATACAGLHVPRLPSAGQPLELSDPAINEAADTATRAIRAREIYNGLIVGAAVVHCGALLALVLHPPKVATGWVVALCAVIMCATCIHAVRHSAVIVTVAYGIISASALLTAGWLSISLENPYVSVLCGLIAVAGVSLPLWLPRCGPIQPTQLVWWERLEGICLAASFPLSLHVAGVFAFIRHWGM